MTLKNIEKSRKFLVKRRGKTIIKVFVGNNKTYQYQQKTQKKNNKKKESHLRNRS